MSLCCSDCFDDEFLERYVEMYGTADGEECKFCGSDQGHRIDATKLEDQLLPVIEYFYMHCGDAEFSYSASGGLVGELIQEHFAVFSAEVNDTHALVKEILRNQASDSQDRSGHCFDDEWMKRAGDFVDNGPKEFFSDLRKGVRRYGHALDPNGEPPIGYEFDLSRAYTETLKFLKRCEEIVPARCEEIVPAGQSLWRGRVGEHNKIKGIVAPPPEITSAMRANQSGSRMLYVASTKEAALAELRPVIDESVTLAEFKPTRDMRVCRLIRERRRKSPFADFDGYRKWFEQREIREYLGGVFSQPLTKSDSPREYLFTQYISNMARKAGFDGIQYRSSQSNDGGENTVFFDPDACEPTGVGEVVSVKTITYKTKSKQVVQFVDEEPTSPRHCDKCGATSSLDQQEN